MRTRFLPCILALVALPVAAHAAPSAREVVEAAAQRPEPNAMHQVVRMRLVDPKGAERTREFELFARRKGDDRQTRIELKKPADVAGTVLLVADGQQHLWLPRLRRVRRVAGKARAGSFMGSDFSFEDLDRRSFDDATYRHDGKATVGGTPCTRITATPTQGTNTAYQRVDTCFGEKHLPLEVRFFTDDGSEPAKVLTVDVDSIEEHDSYRIPRKMTMRAADGHTTELEIVELDTSPELSDRLFDPKSLGR